METYREPAREIPIVREADVLVVGGGTARVLLWGDPEYVRRFAGSTHLYDGDGFDVNEPLATKMASQDHDAEPFDLLNPAYQYYEREFERYWHFFQVFGRLGYNPDTPGEIWEREFERRFGKVAAPPVMRGLHLASRILPRVVAYNYPYHLFPTTRGWVEKGRMEDLPAYADALPIDDGGPEGSCIPGGIPLPPGSGGLSLGAVQKYSGCECPGRGDLLRT